MYLEIHEGCPRNTTGQRTLLSRIGKLQSTHAPRELCFTKVRRTSTPCTVPPPTTGCAPTLLAALLLATWPFPLPLRGSCLLSDKTGRSIGQCCPRVIRCSQSETCLVRAESALGVLWAQARPALVGPCLHRVLHYDTETQSFSPVSPF